MKCVEKWSFPEKYTDQQAFVEPAFPKPLMLYAPFFCRNNTYDPELKRYHWTAAGNVVVPDGMQRWSPPSEVEVSLVDEDDSYHGVHPRETSAYAFYRSLFEEAKSRYPTFAAYEVDFLSNLFLNSVAHRQVLDLYHSWLLALDAAVRDSGLT